jgi:RNA polymerase sigma-70 factor (ECF subfamily)
MQAGDTNTRLNQIATLWSVVRTAHLGPGESGQTARETLLNRYSGAIHRYLLGALRNADAADELGQEFALRFLRGDLRGANPERGRFRDFVKGVLFHMVADYHAKRKREPGLLSPDVPEPGVECPLAVEREEAFRTNWRDDLLARAWLALEAVEKENGQPFYTVLRFKAEHPDVPSAQIAEQLSGPLNRPLNAAGVRKTLERARARFGDLLLDEIAQTVDVPSRERLEEELIDLGLLDHCKEALDRRCS